MSQAKVDRYKEQKANRKAIMKKQKRNRILSSALAIVICVLVVGFIGYSGYQRHEANKPRSSYEVNYGSIDNYLSDLDGED